MLPTAKSAVANIIVSVARGVLIPIDAKLILRYNKVMKTEAIREIMHQAVPFELKTADGSIYKVMHPDFISVDETEDGVAVVHTNTGLAILALRNITAIELNRTGNTG